MKMIFLKAALNFLGIAQLIQLLSCQTIDSFYALKIKTDAITPVYRSALPITSGSHFRNEIPVKAVKLLIDEFEYPRNVTWCKTDDGFVADFINDSVKTVVRFNSNGSCNYYWKKYGENKMPSGIRAILKNSFNDYTIVEITEIRLYLDTENIIYSILIKNADRFKIVRIYNNEMEIEGDYTKP